VLKSKLINIEFDENGKVINSDSFKSNGEWEKEFIVTDTADVFRAVDFKLK
jgi:hypothetical protein